MGREWDGFVSRELLANPPIEPRVTLEVSQGYCLDGLTLPVIRHTGMLGAGSATSISPARRKRDVCIYRAALTSLY